MEHNPLQFWISGEMGFLFLLFEQLKRSELDFGGEDKPAVTAKGETKWREECEIV